MCIVNSSHTDVIEPSNSSPSHLSTVVSLMSSEAQVRTTSGQWTVRIVAYCGTWRYIYEAYIKLNCTLSKTWEKHCIHLVLCRMTLYEF